MCCMMHDMDHTAQGAQTAPGSAPQNESLLDILKRRYALGEITHEQFEEMGRVLGVLGSTPAVAPAAEHAHR